MKLHFRSMDFKYFPIALLLLTLQLVQGDNDGVGEAVGDNAGRDDKISQDDIPPPPEDVPVQAPPPVAANAGVASNLPGFEPCDPAECNQICGNKDPKKAFCSPENSKLCMCAVDNFLSSNVEGLVAPVNRDNPRERDCTFACNALNSYSRIWHRSDYSKSCTCLMNQVTKHGLTLCDEFAIKDWCKIICNSETARCTFNGVCLCRQTWKMAFKKEIAHVRNEVEADHHECSHRCREFNTEYVPRIYDKKVGDSYKFRDKFCLCGDEIEFEDNAMMEKLHDQGFQECTGLKCKMRCGMNMEAECEPKHRRACLCPRYNIFIGRFLWARLPSRKETTCVEACIKNGLAPRVIEWNPFFDPSKDWSNGVYRTSMFPYMYDGKFCHCINLNKEPDINQFRPCTNELCRWICGHSGATCEMKTRRVCICNTHELVGGLGRRPDPGEKNCNVMCRRNMNDARVLDVTWDIPTPHWTVSKAKFCGCIRPVTPAGLTHCEGIEADDLCPKMCNTTKAYCTKDKVCECHVQTNPLENPMIRLPNGKEAEECQEICRSWTWPLTEDTNHKGFIYDEGRLHCAINNTCPAVDTTPWKLGEPGALKVQADAMEMSWEPGRRFCLCIRNDSVANTPGIRLPFTMEPPRLSKTLPCILNHTCIPVMDSVHVVG